MNILPAPLRKLVHSAAGDLPRPFWVLWVGMFVNRCGAFVVPFMAVYLTRGRGFSPVTAGLIVAGYGAGSAIASALGGSLADHLGRRATMVGALTLGGLGMIALGFVRDVRAIAVMVFLVGALGEAYRPAMQAAIADLVPPENRVRAFGVLYWVINLGYSFGVFTAGILATRAFLLLFVGDGLTSLVFALLVWRAVPETRPAHAVAAAPRHGVVGGFFAPYRDRPFAAFVILSVLVLLLFMQHVAALPIDMSARGVSRAWLGFVLSLNGIVIVLVQPFLAPALSRLNRSRVLASGSALFALGFGMYAFGHSPLTFAIGTIVWTIGEIFLLPIANAVVADVALPELRGRYQGAYGLSFGLAGLVAPLLGTSVLQRWGPRVLWGGAFVLGLIVMAGHLALEPRLTRLRERRLASRATPATAAAH